MSVGGGVVGWTTFSWLAAHVLLFHWNDWENKFSLLK
jgi:hypothetical protein